MRPYLESYFDLYWDLHLGVKGDAIPDRVRQIGESFNTVLAYRDPDPENRLRELYEGAAAPRLTSRSGSTTGSPTSRAARYRTRRKPSRTTGSRTAATARISPTRTSCSRCFHNFVALSQWGNTLYNIMLKLATDTGDPETRDWFKKTMEGSPDDAAGKAFTPLERFVMELFRTITPNGGSISALREVQNAAIRAAWLCDHPTRGDQFRSGALGEPDRTSTRTATMPLRPVRRSTKPNASRSALPNVPSIQRAVRGEGRTQGRYRQ